MKVLMFGWEFPPKIYGGLAVASYGITKGLSLQGDVETTFCLPRPTGQEEKFLKDYKKTTEHWDAYYFRVLLYIRQSIGFYFKNKNNKSDESARYRLFVDTLESDPYRSAIKNVPLSKLISYKSRARIFLLKAGMYALYWLTIE